MWRWVLWLRRQEFEPTGKSVGPPGTTSKTPGKGSTKPGPTHQFFDECLNIGEDHIQKLVQSKPNQSQLLLRLLEVLRVVKEKPGWFAPDAN